MPVEFLLSVLGISVVANGALLLWLARADHVTIHWPAGWPIGGTNSGRSGWPAPSSDSRPTQRRALFVAGPSTDDDATRGAIPVLGSNPTTARPLPADLADLLGNPAPLLGNPAPRFRQVPQDGMVRVGTAVPGRAGEAEMPSDPLTALEGPQSWTRIIEVENARLLRYRRPSTIVVVELDGLRKLAERMGEEPVNRLLPVVADALRNEARGSDWVARVGHGRFAAFLAETDEIAAINYVERIRQICEPWLSSAAVPLRLAIGWSSPGSVSDLEFAIKRAEERMHSDRRLPAKLPPSRTAPPRVVALPVRESEPNALSEPFPQANESDQLEALEQTARPSVLP